MLTVIFDMDGTLINSANAISSAVNEIRKNLNLQALDERFILDTINTPGKDWAKILYNIDDFEHSTFKQGFERYFIKHYEQSVILYDGVIDILTYLQNKVFGKNQKTLLYKAECSAPDCIVITGDLIDRNRTDIPAAMDLIRGLVTIAPVYYVSGNHEHQSGEYDNLVELLTAEGVTVLDNGKSIIQRGEERLVILGLADKSVNPYYNSVLRMLSKEHEQDFTLLLSHRPELFSDYVKQQMEGYNLESVDTPLQLFEKLYTGEVDFVFTTQYFGIIEAAKLGIRDYLSFSKQIVWNMPIFIGISQLSPNRKFLSQKLSSYSENPEHKIKLEKKLQDLIYEIELKNRGVVPPAFIKKENSNNSTSSLDLLSQEDKI